MSSNSRWTREDLLDYLNRRREAELAGKPDPTKAALAGEQCPVVQERQAPDQGPDNHATGGAGVDDESYPRFTISVHFYLSDQRLRDLPGMLETICDCVCAAGRQLAGVGRRKGVMRVGQGGRGRVRYNYRDPDSKKRRTWGNAVALRKFLKRFQGKGIYFQEKKVKKLKNPPPFLIPRERPEKDSENSIAPQGHDVTP